MTVWQNIFVYIVVNLCLTSNSKHVFHNMWFSFLPNYLVLSYLNLIFRFQWFLWTYKVRSILQMSPLENMFFHLCIQVHTQIHVCENKIKDLLQGRWKHVKCVCEVRCLWGVKLMSSDWWERPGWDGGTFQNITLCGDSLNIHLLFVENAKV